MKPAHRRPLDGLASEFGHDTAIRRALDALTFEANRMADLAERLEARIAELEAGQGFLAGKAGERDRLHGTSDNVHA